MAWMRSHHQHTPRLRSAHPLAQVCQRGAVNILTLQELPMRYPSLQTLLPLAVLGAMTLAGCDQREDPTVGQKVDETIQQAERQTDQMQSDTSAAMANAERALSEAATSAGNTAQDLGQKVETQTQDAAITARINAALIADEQLKASRIDVDTTLGEVRLSGEAPTEKAKERATDLAEAVEGVKDVTNDLTVQKGK
jgi:osmotically-inducible protein OsmY